MGKDRIFILGGYIFLIWGIFDLILKIYRYGFLDMEFFWFCTVASFILAFGLLYSNEVLLNSFVSMAIIVQPFWILDYIWISFFNTPLNGNSIDLFQPGYGFFDFISSSRHLFMLPFGFYGVFIKCRKNTRSYLFIPLFIILLLGTTYIFSPRNSNINCVFRPCTNIFGEMQGFNYFVLFTMTVIVFSIIVSFVINFLVDGFSKIRDTKNKKIYKRHIFRFFLVLVLISSLSVSAGFIKHIKLPNSACLKEESCKNCTVYLFCEYIYKNDDNLLLLYDIKNSGDKTYICDVQMRIIPSNKNFEKILRGYLIFPHKEYKLEQPIPYPNLGSQIKLKLDCQSLK